jgi:hypothetical protein
MHWVGVKSEKYLQLSDSHPGSAATDRSSTGYSGAEMAINDLQDILRASNELRHEREKFVGSRNRKLYELDEAAQVSEDEDAAHTHTYTHTHTACLSTSEEAIKTIAPACTA